MRQSAQQPGTRSQEPGTGEREIVLQHFAVFREARGTSSETVTTTAATPRALYEELGLGEVFPFDEQRLRVARNDEFATWDDPLENGDVVVFLAPSSGG